MKLPPPTPGAKPDEPIELDATELQEDEGVGNHTGGVPALQKPTRRFRTRVFFYLLVLTLVTSAVSGGTYYSRQVRFIEKERGLRAHTLLTSLATQSELGAYAGDSGILDLPARRTMREPDVVMVAIYDAAGKPVLSLSAPAVGQPIPPSKELVARLEADPDQPPIRMPGGEGYEDLWAPILTSARPSAVALHAEPGSLQQRREVVGLARIGLSLKPAREQLDEVLRAGLILTSALVVLGALAALLLARAISEPVMALARGADDIRRGKLDVRIDVGSRDELGLLAENFNRMAGQLRSTMGELASLNRNLESEVSRRTDEIRRQAEFTEMLNAPLAPGLREAGAFLELEKLLGNAAASLQAATNVRGVGIYVTRADSAEFALALIASVGVEATALGDPPSEALCEVGRPSLTAGRAIVPVVFRGKAQGCLVLVDEPVDPFAVDFAAHAAGPLAIAISNARAYAALSDLASQLKERNTALEKQRDQLQEMNRLKSEFLANVSHELRTPLNAILGYTEILSEGVYGSINAEQGEALNGVSESGQSLLTLINQILDLSKVEAGKTEVYVTEVAVHDVVQAVVAEAQALAKNRPYKVQAKCPARVVVKTDASKVKQIVTNLVSNAIKFTEKGGVVVEVRAATDGGCSVAVRDTGIGIKKEHQSVIFEEFRQVDGSSTRKFQGTGLGLSIVRRFAGLLGGNITVESTLNIGSTFTLTLPANPPQRPPTLPPGARLGAPSSKMDAVRK
jgi:signal transduction histidine kinase/HAMP domain-containing protein